MRVNDVRRIRTQVFLDLRIRAKVGTHRNRAMQRRNQRVAKGWIDSAKLFELSAKSWLAAITEDAGDFEPFFRAHKDANQLAQMLAHSSLCGFADIAQFGHPMELYGEHQKLPIIFQSCHSRFHFPVGVRMASTNRVKGAGRSPAWAGRGKLRPAHVFGGPSEAARIIYRAGWDGSPAGLLPVSRYGQELVDELCRRKINCVCLTWSPGFSLDGDVPQWELVGRLLPLLKKKRIRPVAEISLTGCFANEMFPRVPESKGWVERNADRTPVAHYNKDCLQMNVKSDAWRQYLAQKLRMALGAGFDGFYFSDALSNPSDTAALISQLTALAVSCRPPDADELLIYSDAWRAEAHCCGLQFQIRSDRCQAGLRSRRRDQFEPAGVESAL